MGQSMIQNIKLYLLENNTGQIPGVKENPRDLTGDGFAKAKQSIKDFPEMLEVRTLVAVKHEDRFVVIGGNQRLRAMRDLDYDTAPVMVVDWTVGKINEFIIKDNIEYGVWNFDLLANEWDSNLLVDWGMNLPVEFGDVDDITEGLTDENEVPEILPNPKSKIGDVWICGNHRVMCGDSTSIDAVERLMDGQKADMVFTDPPYGMSYGGGRAAGEHALDKKTGGVKIKAHGMIMNDDLQGDDLLQLVKDALGSAIAFSKEGAAAYTCFTWRTYAEFQNALLEAGLAVKNCIVWDKKSIGLGNSHYRPQHEFIFYSGGQWYGDKSESDVWYMSRGATGQYVHPTQKPVELIERALENSSKKGDVVIDVFGGSDSTLIACEKTNRQARLMELDPKYCDVIVKRWQDFTGKDAILESTQQKFNEL